MLNHVEKPLTLGVLKKTIERAKEVGLTTIVCADSIVEASMIAKLDPDIIVAEPSELIGTGLTSGPEYVEAASRGVKEVNPDILVLTAAGISNGQDVYNTIIAGADATGSSSGVAKGQTQWNSRFIRKNSSCSPWWIPTFHDVSVRSLRSSRSPASRTARSASRRTTPPAPS